MFDTILPAVQWLLNNLTDFVLPFVIILSILVFVHEWGHYIVARMCGVRVEEFSIGFGKELFGYTDKAGTRWKFSLVPLGGYVKMFGDVDPASAQHSKNVEIEDSESHETRPMTEDERKVAFFAKPVWQRAAVVFAGPAINFIFALMVFTFIFSYQGRTITPPVAAAIIKGGAADSYNMQPHDVLVNVNGREMERFEDIQRQVMVMLDQGIDISIVRGGEEIKNTVMRPEKVEIEDRHGFTHSRGMLGILAPGGTFPMEDVVGIAGEDVSALSIEDKKQRLIANFDTTFEVTLSQAADKELTQTLIIHPRSNENEAFISGESNMPILHGLNKTDVKMYSIWGAFMASIQETEEILSGTLDALGQMFTGVRSPTELGGIIRIGAVAGDAANAGMFAILSFAALLSINLGLLNLFPIPVLDGGHLLFYFIEAVKGSPVPEKIQEYAFGAGMLIIIGLMLFANLNDLYQILIS